MKFYYISLYGFMYNLDTTYCLINILKKKSIITLYVYHSSGYPYCFTAGRSVLIYRLMSSHDIFGDLSISHLLYISNELYKAEISLYTGQLYIQS